MQEDNPLSGKNFKDQLKQIVDSDSSSEDEFVKMQATNDMMGDLGNGQQ